MVDKIKIIPQKRRRGRFSIFVGDKFESGISKETYEALAAKFGGDFSEVPAKKLFQKKEELEILGLVLNFLSFRPRTEKEIINYLNKKKVDSRIQLRVIRRLRELGFLDDERFCELWIRDRMRLKPRGGRRIFQELILRGVNKNLAKNMIEKLLTKEEAINLAKCALEKKSHLWRHLKPQFQKKKSVEYLLRLGFNWDTIKEVLEHFVKSEIISDVQ